MPAQQAKILAPCNLMSEVAAIAGGTYFADWRGCLLSLPVKFTNLDHLWFEGAQ